jgi:hypothetical protein
MKLIHYTNEKFDLKPKTYDQSELNWQAKPNGFWVSVEGPYDWEWWCKSEDYNLENLAISYEIKLKEDSKILYLETEREIYNMTIRFPYMKPQWDNPEGHLNCRTYELDWKKVKEKYQGIIIPQYQWECRMSQKSCWYYGWDCASGCIWDLTCIEEFKLNERN